MVLKSFLALSVFFSSYASASVPTYSPYVYDYSKVDKTSFAREANSSSINVTYEPIGAFEVKFSDEEGIGVNDIQPYTTPSGDETTLGEYRKQIITTVIEAYSTQLAFGNFVPQIEIKFEDNDGFLAVTFGPNFSTGHNADSYGVIDSGRQYPSTLANSVNGSAFSSEVSTTLLGSGSGLLNFTEGLPLPNLAYVVYHELTHVVGFVALDCPSSQACLPGPVIYNDHIQKYFVYHDGTNVLPYEDLNMAGRLEAMLSGNKVWFSGSAQTRAAVSSELVSGHDDGRIFMHAEPQSFGDLQGDFDGQSGSHVSREIQPAQLMYSAGAFVDDLGVASYILCDIGWCRNQGKVIDLKTQAFVSGNTSDAGNPLIEIRFQNLANVNVDAFNAQVMFLSGLNVISVVDPDNLCTSSSDGLLCSGSLAALEEHTLMLEVQSSDDYPLTGQIKSAGFDVDRNGFNNILSLANNTAPFFKCNGAIVDDGGTCDLSVSTLTGEAIVEELEAFDLNGDEITFEYSKVGEALDFITQGDRNEVFVLQGSDIHTRWQNSAYIVTISDGVLSSQITLNVTNILFEENEAPTLICSIDGSIPCVISVADTQEVLIDDFSFFDNNSSDVMTFTWQGQGTFFPFSVEGEQSQFARINLPEDSQSWETVTYTLVLSDGVAEASLDFELTNANYEDNSGSAPTPTPPTQAEFEEESSGGSVNFYCLLLLFCAAAWRKYYQSNCSV